MEKNLLKGLFFLFIYYSIFGNKVAHVLADMALTHAEEVFAYLTLLSWICLVRLNEITSFE